MSNLDGSFVWYELTTTDPHAAETFYQGVAGWSAKDAGIGDKPYTILSANGAMVGGLMAIPPDAREKGAPPRWTGYIAVGEVDGTAARVAQAGGSIHHGPAEIPGVGRFAVVADPQGAMFVLFKGNGEPAPQGAPGAPGHIGWHELHAADWESAFAFYSGLFGWTKAEAVDMGPIGTYQTFATGGAPVGGMMTKFPAEPRPSWLYYVNVEEIDAAAARVKQGGGQVVNGPQQVPGGSWIVHGLDPQGAQFALVGPRG